jgi:hypothetical protein
MNYSKHAMKRSQQRGIPFNDIDLILQFGERERKPGGAWEYRIPKRRKGHIISQLKSAIQNIEKAVKEVAIVSEDGEIITVYNK